MNQLIEKPDGKNEWGLVETKPGHAPTHWKESAEYKRTTEFVQKTYGPFGGVVFAGIGVMLLAAIGIWGIGLLVEGLELVLSALRNLPAAETVGGAVGSIAAAIFAAGWKAALAALVLFPVWYGLKRSYRKFLSLLAASPLAPSPSADVVDLAKRE